MSDSPKIKLQFSLIVCLLRIQISESVHESTANDEHSCNARQEKWKSNGSFVVRCYHSMRH